MKVHRWDNLPSSKVSLSARLAQVIRSPTPRVTLMLGGGGLLLLLVALWTPFYTVDPHERAVVTRFGEVVRIAEPGLHFKWPLAIERVRLVSTERVLKQEFGFRTKGAVSAVETLFHAAIWYAVSRPTSMTSTANAEPVSCVWRSPLLIEPMKDFERANGTRASIRSISPGVFRFLVSIHSELAR